ncbi:ABC transporter permease subunit [Lignipirellula cremea]|uniref:ABC transporter permease subunit n=1 Tax=Lignipirellula cremea TaxID=2528010 RepID=UPI0011A70D27|nr:ABC transporter permease subunit [Lignipirellula cremea]
MWTYIVRRLLLMIPTLFGITIVTFSVMQLAPGDPMLQNYEQQGASGQGQTRESYVLQMRDLKLDKPQLLNFRHYYNYTDELRQAAFIFSREPGDWQPFLTDVAEHPDKPENAAFLKFVRGLQVKNLDRSLENEDERASLGRKISDYAQSYLEKQGSYAVSQAMELLQSDELTPRLQIGLIKTLNMLVVEANKATYSSPPLDEETPSVQRIWRLWWSREEANFPPLDDNRQSVLEQKWAAILDPPAGANQLKLYRGIKKTDIPFFYGKLESADTTLAEKVAAAKVLKLLSPQPLQFTVRNGADATTLDEVEANWAAYYQSESDRYNPSAFASAIAIVGDTQYAHMLWRLVTFRFGRSALKTREPVSEKIWKAFLVSAPLMLASQLVIYLIAVPLGVTCAVNRDNMVDRGISLTLFLLYSVPPYVAGMMFLLFFCYNVFLNIFPMERLHSQGAENLGYWAYFLDYLWHATLPVACLSMFSMAGIAMYARTSLLDVLGQDFIRTARAKGVSSFKVVYVHAFRNSLIPILTLFSSILPAMLGGSVLIEYLFSVPGMGRLVWESIDNKDYPTMMALVYVQAIVVLFSILLTDLLYVVADPRISFGSRGK